MATVQDSSRMWKVLCVLVVCFASPPLRGEILGKVVGVHDGDSITVLTGDKTELKVRLEGIDAPELKQAFGNVSKQELSRLLFGKPVRLEDIQSIRAPALVAVGTKDDITGSPHELAALMPNGRGLDIPDRDHMVAVGDKVFKAEAITFLHSRP